MLLINLRHLMTSLALPSPKIMIVLGTCNASPVYSSEHLLMYRKILFDPCQIPVGYRYINVPFFSYADEDCCMKSMMIRQSGSAIVMSKKVLDDKRPSIESPLLFVCGAAHVKSIN
jgi:hypothetical protein